MSGLVATTVASRSSGRRRAKASRVDPPLNAITSPGFTSPMAAFAIASFAVTS